MPIPSQSVVIPAFNEELRIEQTVHQTLAWLDSQPFESELVVVDDGSTDRTLAILEPLSDSSSSLRVIASNHAGKAAAVRKGMQASTGDLVLFADADLATPIEYIEQFREVAKQGADVVIGSREGADARRIGEPVRVL